ncbi:MAG: glycosyltransferase [Bacteroidetes bacterium]|nr:glycosyltransferase [Bacteroidota bacterium]
MIILHIPSWYASPQSPLAGVFIKEQIMAYATFYPDDKNYISDFYGKRISLMISQPLDSGKKIFEYFRSPKQSVNPILSNLTELQTKFVAGNEKVFGPLLDNIFDAVESQLIYLISRKDKPDILHAHVSYPGGIVAQRLSKKYNIPYVVSEQSGVALLHAAFTTYGLKDAILSCFKNASAVSALSTFHKAELQKLGIENISVIPNLVNEEIFVIPAEKSKGEYFTFFSLANLKESKGIKDLLLGIAKVVVSRKNVRFRIGGGGNESNYFMQMAIDLKIDKYIDWLGEIGREAAAAEFKNCDAFVLPSKSESFGVVYIEALACGKPVVATNCGGPADSVNNANGLLVEVGDIDAIANAMIYVMDNIETFDGEKIREDVLSKFSRKVVTSKMHDFYLQLNHS